MPTKMSDSLSQGIADKYCSLHIAHLALTSHCVVILSSLYDIERAGVTGKYTQVSSAIFSVASSCCPLILIHFIWTIFKAMSRLMVIIPMLGGGFVGFLGITLKLFFIHKSIHIFLTLELLCKILFSLLYLCFFTLKITLQN